MKNTQIPSSLFLLLLISLCWLLPQPIAKAELRHRTEQRIAGSNLPKAKMRKGNKPQKTNGDFWRVLGIVFLLALYISYLAALLFTFILALIARATGSSAFVLGFGWLLLIAPIVFFALYAINPSENFMFFSMGLSHLSIGLILYWAVTRIAWMGIVGLVLLLLKAALF